MPKKRKTKSSLKRKKSSPISRKTILLLAIGIVLVVIPSAFYLNETIQLAFFTPKVTHSKNHLPAPVAINIPSVQIDLPVFQTALAGSTWQIAPDGISHLAISANPGEEGSIILYGHNTNDRLGPIRWLSQGQKILITTSDKKIHTYEITKTEQVSSNRTDALVNVSGETVILYTCDGFADLQRFLVFAKPI